LGDETQDMLAKVAKDREREVSTLGRVFFPKCCAPKKHKIHDEDGLDKDMAYAAVLDKVISDMSATHLFKEVYKLKTAV